MMAAMDRAALRRSLVALGVTYSVLWACAPAFSVPPPVPMSDGRQLELGAAGGVTLAEDDPFGNGTVYPDGMLFFRAHTAPRLDVGLTAFGGLSTLVGLGAWLDWRIVDTDRVVLGPGIAGGFLYAEASLPVAVRVAPTGWLYTRPRFGFGRAEIPLGFTLSLPQGVGLMVEAGLAFPGDYGGGVLYGPYPTAALGVTWQLRP
jgi:hypothetical protein